MNLTHLAIKRPVTTIMTFVAMGLIGLISWPLIPLESFPDIDFPGFFIQVPYPNSSPKEVETEIIRPIEEALATMSGIRIMNSNSNRNGGGIFVLFGWDADINTKRLEARAKIDAIAGQLPVDLERIPINIFSSGDQAILTIRISSERDLSNAYDMLDRNLIKRLERLEGVSSIRLYGVDKREIRIQLEADRIASHNINLFQLSQQLKNSNFSISAGDINTDNQQLLIRPTSEFKTLDDIRNIIIQPSMVKLSDIASVNYDSPEREHGRHLDGSYAVGVDVFKQNGANLVDVSTRALEEVAVVGELDEMQGINLYVMDNQGQDVKRSLDDLMMSGLLGAVLAFIVLFLFLRHTMSTLLVALSVPFSLLITLGALYFAGFTINILTLMGMMLAIGMLVDNSVVVTENIFRKRHEIADPVEATKTAVHEVSLAIIAGTLTSVIVFAPIVFGAQNSITLYLTHVAFTIIVALLASLLIAQTLIPMLAVRIKSIGKAAEGPWMKQFADRYAKTLNWALRRPWWSFLGIILILASTVPAASLTKFDMFADEVSNRLQLRYNIRGIHPLEVTEKSVDTIEAFLFKNKDRFGIESVYSFFSEDRAESTIILKESKDSDPTKIQKLIEEEVPQIIIGTPSFERRRTGSNEEGFKVQIFGDSTERLLEISSELITLLRSNEGLINILPDVFRSGSEIQIKIKPDRAAQLGISPSVVANSVSVALRGENLRKLRGDDGEIAIRLLYSEEDSQSLSSLKQLPIYTADNNRVSLEQVADISIQYGQTVIRRQNRRTNLSISADFAEDANNRQVRQEAQKLLSLYNFPPGYGWGFGQGFNDEDEAQKTMIFNTLLAIPLIFIVMAALFESLLYPLSIITSIVFSFIGVLWFFALTGTTFTIMSAIGILILIGIVVNNGIVLVEHINFLRKTGLQRNIAIVRAGRDRLRPILMTVITTVLGLVPLAIGGTQMAGNGPAYYPMARAIIGGLTFSTIVSLLVVPIVYAWLDGLSRWTSSIIREART